MDCNDAITDCDLQQELKLKIARLEYSLRLYHALCLMRVATNISLEMLALLTGFGIVPLSAAIIASAAQVNQWKKFHENINEYKVFIQQCHDKINHLKKLDTKENSHAIHKQLQCIVTLMQEATQKILLNSFWQAFMIAGGVCLFFCANPVIGLGIVAAGLVVYASLNAMKSEHKPTQNPLLTTRKAQQSGLPFAQIIQRVREFCEIPNPARAVAYGF